jgi:hypothetical protein
MEGEKKIVGHSHTLNPFTRANLVLPLSRHDFCIDSGDEDACKHAGLVVSLDDVAAVDLAGPHTAVVRTLGARETTLGPSVRPAIGVQEGIFLLNSEPELVSGMGLHQLGGFMAEVEFVGSSVRAPGLAQDEDVVSLAERIWEDGDGANVDIGVLPRGLAGRGAVEVPFGKLVHGGDRLGESLEAAERSASHQSSIIGIQQVVKNFVVWFSFSLQNGPQHRPQDQDGHVTFTGMSPDRIGGR